MSFVALAEELTNDEKAAVVRKVYNKVYSAMGTAENQPRFKFDADGTMFMAYMSQDRDGNPEIAFEGKAFDVCAEFGPRRDDAIAILIGHEIAHHRLQHHWGDSFESSYTLEALKKEFSEADYKSGKKFETQADERGGIYCYLAGFNPLNLTDKLFRRLYDAYAIKPTGKYPTLEERIQIAHERDSIVATFIQVFETGNYAMLIGEYDVAINCFNYIISKEFHSREIYNNLGVVYFLKGVSKSDQADIRFIYPIEIDLDNRMRSQGTKGMNDNVRSIFEEAKAKFKQAVAFDENYATGYVNLASALSVLGDYEKALDNAEEALKLAKRQKLGSTEMNAELVMALVAQLDPEGDKEESVALVEKLSGKNHLLSTLNKQIIEGKKIESLGVQSVPLSWMDGSFHNGSVGKKVRERINGMKYYSIDELTKTEMREEKIMITRDAYVIAGLMSDSKILAVDGNSKFFVFHSTLDNYKDTTMLGAKLGSTQEEIIAKYGMPTSVLSSNRGTLLNYNASQLVMVLNDQNQLIQWMIWRTIDDL